MQAARRETFSEGVIAIITNMALKKKVPHDTSPAALYRLWPDRSVEAKKK